MLKSTRSLLQPDSHLGLILVFELVQHRAKPIQTPFPNRAVSGYPFLQRVKSGRFYAVGASAGRAWRVARLSE